jgi:hypothetical protein
LLPSCLRYGHRPRSSDLDQLRSAKKTLSFYASALGEQLGAICSSLNDVAQAKHASVSHPNLAGEGLRRLSPFATADRRGLLLLLAILLRGSC